jgi:rSAM/selenodomain-associated transferase 1
MKAIVIMAKEPRPGLVKTRMVSDLDPTAVSKLYLGFLMDRIEQVREISHVDHYIAYTPESTEGFFKKLAPSEFLLIPQDGEDLGERLSNISERLFKEGYRNIVIMDSDSPNLPSRLITSSLDVLEEGDIVLGPCEDGGYYLVGLNHQIPEIFRDIPWSTSEVVAVTKERANSEGKSIKFLEKWYDVDTREDLIRLKEDLDNFSKDPKDMFFCQNTYNIISEIDIS